MAGIPYVFTLSRVAEMLGEDEEWLREISVAMDPEEGSLWVFGVGEHGVPAFTEYGIECLQQIIADARDDGRAPRPKRKGYLSRTWVSGLAAPRSGGIGAWRNAGP